MLPFSWVLPNVKGTKSVTANQKILSRNTPYHLLPDTVLGVRELASGHVKDICTMVLAEVNAHLLQFNAGRPCLNSFQV